jgi:ribosomal protein S18 acetylase RimI-like enzyme
MEGRLEDWRVVSSLPTLQSSNFSTMTKISLRPATLDDAQELAQLWVATFPDKFGPILGEKAEAILCDWLRLSQRHLQTTTLAEISGRLAGFIVLENSSAPPGDDGRWLWHALQLHHGLFGALRGLALMLLVDTHHQLQPHEVYIEMLGVDPVWRGLGLAQELLAYAEEVAQRHGVEQLTLYVVNDNTVAIRLYEKWGFTIATQRRSRLLKWITGHPGYYKMVKQLSIINYQLSKRF